jgi:peptidylprolyl isomerase
VATDVGITVSGSYGSTPALTIPSAAAPAQLTQQTLTEGTGATVGTGDLLIANYLGETWAAKDGKPNIFDSSFSRGTPAAFVIGTGAVISGWDKTLVGKKLGSRVLLTIPPADGYGADGRSDAGISGTDTLVFVVDLVGDYKPGASAPGTAVTGPLAAGQPAITNTVAAEPKITSTAGVAAPDSPSSTLLVKGSGDKIDSSKTLVLELVQTDIATGKDTHSTWADAPEAVTAQNVLAVADALNGQNIGSRAVALLPAVAASGSQPAEPAAVLIFDVIGQF